MGRRRRRNVSARKKVKIEECDDDNHSAQNSDGNGDDEKSAKNEANTDNQSSEEKIAMDSFYEKLIKLNEPSGLSLVFNFRETKLDLYFVYKEVTERGGSFEVSKAGKWNEVASALSIKIHASILPSQIQKVYENLLWQYEQIHHYRAPAKVLGEGYNTECSVRKRKCCDRPSEDDQEEKGKCIFHNCQVSRGPGRPRKHPALTEIRDPFAPQKAKTSYQLFVKMECERLRKIHGEGSGDRNLREMAIEAWRRLSKDDRLPYVEASRKDKERFDREMAVYNQNKNKKVTMAGDLLNGNFQLPNESLVESTIQMLKNAKPNDPIFEMNWDGGCRSPDSPSYKDHKDSKLQLLGSSNVEG